MGKDKATTISFINMEALYEGDCLEIMRTLSSESVDMIFADPPFNVGKKYGGKSDTDRRSDYYEWCAAWIAEGFRLLKQTGTFYLMTISRHVFRMGCEMEKHGVFINKVEWRNVSASHSKRGFWSSTQPIVVFGKTDKFKFNTYAQRRKITQPRWGGYNSKPQGQLLDYWDDIPFVYSGSVAHPEAILRDCFLKPFGSSGTAVFEPKTHKIWLNRPIRYALAWLETAKIDLRNTL